VNFEWSYPSFNNAKEGPGIREVEEAFEDPMGIRLIPDSPRFLDESRAICLGRSLAGRGIFAVYRSDGKTVRVIVARPMTPEEEYFYDRKVSEWIS
jgi:uncharacterized DUF497 family protein